MLHFVLVFFGVHHLSTFKRCFCFFGVSTVDSSLTFSFVLFLLFCNFNILFLFTALCLFIANSVYYADKLIKY